MSDYYDVKKTEVKIINGTKWQFEFRENGYVILSMYSEIKEGKAFVPHWQSQLHAVDVSACMQYVYVANNRKGEFLNYDDIEVA